MTGWRLGAWVMRVALVVASAAGAVQAQVPTLAGPLPVPLPLFPADNWWNADISVAPVGGGRG